MYLRRLRCFPTIFFLLSFINGPRTARSLALTIDNRLAAMTNDCYTRVSIGSKLVDGNSHSSLAVRSFSECEDECSRRRNSCYAFSFGVGTKGNGSCAFATRIPHEPDDFEAHPDYDVYVRKYGSPHCESDRLYENLKITRNPAARRKETNGTSIVGTLEYAPPKFLSSYTGLTPFVRQTVHLSSLNDDTVATRHGTTSTYAASDADDLPTFAYGALDRFPSVDDDWRHPFRPLDFHDAVTKTSSPGEREFGERTKSVLSDSTDEPRTFYHYGHFDDRRTHFRFPSAASTYACREGRNKAIVISVSYDRRRGMHRPFNRTARSFPSLVICETTLPQPPPRTIQPSSGFVE